jgi:hypothetical protein
MHLAQHNDVVQTLAPDRSDQPLDNAILPGRGWCGRLVPDTHGAQSARDNAAIDPIPIADEVVRSLVPRKCLRFLTRNPFGRRICCDVGPDEVSAAEPDDDEGIEQSKPIVGTTNRSMAAMSGAWLRRKVRHPWLGGPRRLTMYLATLDWATSNPSLSGSPWMRGAPQSGFSTLIRRINARNPVPSPWARFPTPVAAKAGPMPTHERLGPDDCENLRD